MLVRIKCVNQIWTKCEICWFKLAPVTPSLVLSGTHQGVPVACGVYQHLCCLTLIFCNLVLAKALQSRALKVSAAIWICITIYYCALNDGIIHTFIFWCINFLWSGLSNVAPLGWVMSSAAMWAFLLRPISNFAFSISCATIQLITVHSSRRHLSGTPRACRSVTPWGLIRKFLKGTVISRNIDAHSCYAGVIK